MKRFIRCEILWQAKTQMFFLKNYRFRGTTSTKKQTKLNLDDLFSHSEEEIIDQLQTFSKEFREEFCKILAQTNADKKIISHKASLFTQLA